MFRNLNKCCRLRNKPIFKKKKNILYPQSIKRNFSAIDLLNITQSNLQYIHNTYEIPWAIVIILSTIGIRGILTFPLAVYSRKCIVKSTSLQPLLLSWSSALKDNLIKNGKKVYEDGSPIPGYLANSGKTIENTRNLNNDEINLLISKERRKIRVNLFKKFGCQTYKSLLSGFLQVPVWIIMSTTLRGMCGSMLISSIPIDFSLNSVESLNLFGLINFNIPSLLEQDPSGICPVLIGIIGLVNIEITSRYVVSRQYSPTKLSKLLTDAGRLGSLILMVFSFHAPLALVLYWLTSVSFSLFQNIFLNTVFPIRTVFPDQIGKRLKSTDLLSANVSNEKY